MKANRKTRKAADHVDARRNDKGGFTYQCLLCDYVMESNAPNETTYKAIVAHAAKCDGTNPRPLGVHDPETKIVKFPAPPTGDVETFNKYVKEFADHIKYCVPNGKKLSDKEAIALARIAIDSGLSPFIGELWYLPGLGPHIGIGGLRRKAKEQALYSKSHRPMTPDEITEHGVQVEAGDIGYICELFRHDVTQQAAQINQMAGEVVIKIEPILGVGIFRAGNPIPNGRSAAWVAGKRAEADALKQAYDIGICLPIADGPEYLEVTDQNGAQWTAPDPVIQRQAAENAERRTTFEVGELPSEPTKTVVSKYTEPVSYDHIIEQHLAGAVEAPQWLTELRTDIEGDPKRDEPMGPHWIHQFVGLTKERITTEQLEAFLKIVLQNPTHQVEELTFGAVRILKPFVTDNPDFEAQVIGLLS